MMLWSMQDDSMKEGHAQAVKLEGGKEVCPQIKAIVDASIPVCAHLGSDTTVSKCIWRLQGAGQG